MKNAIVFLSLFMMSLYISIGFCFWKDAIEEQRLEIISRILNCVMVLIFYLRGYFAIYIWFDLFCGMVMFFEACSNAKQRLKGLMFRDLILGMICFMDFSIRITELA